MTDAVVLALIGVLVVAIGAIAPTMMGWAALQQCKINNEQIKLQTKKTDTVIEKADEIHQLADGNLSKATAALDKALAKIETLNNTAITNAAANTALIEELHKTITGLSLDKALLTHRQELQETTKQDIKS